jgi:hypothetical protein
MVTRAALLLLLVVGCTQPQRKATLAVASTALLLVDWSQTREIVAICQEQNPIIGWCGERVPVDAYFPVVILANLVIGYFAHESYMAGITGAQTATVVGNHVYLEQFVRQ